MGGILHRQLWRRQGARHRVGRVAAITLYQTVCSKLHTGTSMCREPNNRAQAPTTSSRAAEHHENSFAADPGTALPFA